MTEPEAGHELHHDGGDAAIDRALAALQRGPVDIEARERVRAGIHAACNMISPGLHGAGAGRAGAAFGEGAGAPDEQDDARPGPVPAVVAGAGVVPGPARGDGFSYWTFDPVREVWRSSTSEPMCCEDGCREPGAVLIAGLLYCTKHAATEYCRWPVLSPCPRGECRDCDENEEA
jgi:hypothetical protein